MKILLKDGTSHTIDPLELRMLTEAYPRIDVEKELRKMAEWCRANPQRRKTKKGISRFINGWLQRTPEKKTQSTIYAAAHKPFEKEAPRQMTREAGLAGIAALKQAVKRKTPDPRKGG